MEYGEPDKGKKMDLTVCEVKIVIAQSLRKSAELCSHLQLFLDSQIVKLVF